MLHPRHKLEYFKRHKWEDAWIQAASDIVHDEFSRTYESIDGPDVDLDDDGNAEHNSNEVGVQTLLVHALTVHSSDSFKHIEYLRRAS